MLRVEHAFVHPGPARRRHPISFSRYTTQGFCHDCNKHFGMLEEKASPTVEAMARGSDVVLDAAQQQMLALWANKTAFALRTAENKHNLPFARDQLGAVRRGMVAPRTWVGFFSWKGEPLLATGTGRLNSPAFGEQRAYFAVLAFVHISFCVTAIAEPLVGKQRISADLEAVAQCWPPRYSSLSWPWTPLDNRVLPRLMGLVPLTGA